MKIRANDIDLRKYHCIYIRLTNALFYHAENNL